MIPPAVSFVQESHDNQHGTDEIELAGGNDANHARKNEQKDRSAKKPLCGQLRRNQSMKGTRHGEFSG
jgi:hypothetical protein